MSSSWSSTQLDRPLGREGDKVSLSVFSFLFAEIIRWAHSGYNVNTIQEVEDKLCGLGYSIGIRLLELLKWRERKTETRRSIEITNLLWFVATDVWKSLFGREATLSQCADGRYLVTEQDYMTVSKFVSMPSSSGKKRTTTNANPNAFLAGIVEGMLEAAEFPSAVIAIGASSLSIKIEK